jgi:hypothetical protein
MRTDVVLPLHLPVCVCVCCSVLWDDRVADTDGSFQALLDNWNDWDCKTKVAMSKGGGANSTYTGIQSTSLSYSSDRTQATVGFSLTISESARPRYWFFTFARCNPTAPGFQNVDFRIHATQESASWSKEFGYNENGINTLYIVFMFLFSVVVFFECYGTYKLQQKLSYLHPMLKLALISIVIEWISLFVLLLHYGSYSSNGEGILILMKLGQVLAVISRCFLMLLLLLLSKGWTISNETLTHKWAIVGVIATYLIVSISSLIYSYSAEDLMRTTPTTGVEAFSIILNLVWLGFAGWFVFSIFWVSYRKEDNPAKSVTPAQYAIDTSPIDRFLTRLLVSFVFTFARKKMYLMLGLLFTPWFFLPPLTSFAVFAVDPWARDRVVGQSTIAHRRSLVSSCSAC